MDVEEHNTGQFILEGKYRLERVIGAGGMGQVWEATNLRIGRKVAIKYLHSKYIDDNQVIRRFHQEARLAASIGHDNICEVTDLGEDDSGSPYLVMPLLSGTSLDRLLDEENRLPLARAIDIVCQILSAIDAAHKNHIVHRDLKPKNVFITQVGDRGDFVKLLDFGISKVLDQDRICALTKSGIVLGTPHYMAPEQAQGMRELDYRVDVYAAGVILYEMLTGARPFDGESYNEIMVKIVSEQFPPPGSLNPQIPKAVEAVIIKAMSRNRDDRFSNADEMRLALEECPSDFLSTRNAAEASINTTAWRTAPPFNPAGLPHRADPEVSGARRVAGGHRQIWLAALLAAVCAGVAGAFLALGSGYDPAQARSAPAAPDELKEQQREEQPAEISTKKAPNSAVESSAPPVLTAPAPQQAAAKKDFKAASKSGKLAEPNLLGRGPGTDDKLPETKKDEPPLEVEIKGEAVGENRAVNSETVDKEIEAIPNSKDAREIDKSFEDDLN